MRDKDLQDAVTVYDFLRKKYLYWLESLSLLRSISEGVTAVRKLEALVVVSCYKGTYKLDGLTCWQKAKEARQLIELLRDARHFILSYKQAMEIAPLQVYASALVFSPTRSLIRELFEKEEPNWIMLKPSVESDWNACLQTLEGHDDSVTSVAFSADSQRVVSGSRDKTVKIWDMATGACVQMLKGHNDSVNLVAFSADSQQVASGSSGRKVKIWDMATGTCMQMLEGYNDSINSIAFLADG
jgi:WD40 repeat protein